MEQRDLLVTPIFILLIIMVAYVIRPKFTDEITKKYFLPALLLKIFGAIAVGIIYQFYYGGGDTFAYHTHGSRHIWEAFTDSYDTGVRIFFNGDRYGDGMYKYTSRIWMYNDPNSFFIIRIAFLFDLLTYSTYSATATLFALLSFIGGWLLFITFYRKYPEEHKWLAMACLFIPSVFFWGSGILKDSVTLACLGIATYCIDKLLLKKSLSIAALFWLLLSCYTIFSVKKYILLSFLPAALVWVFASYTHQIKSTAVRVMIIPIVAFVCVILAYFTIQKVGEGDSRYAIDRIGETARITAYDIRYGWGARTGEGSGYTLGELDGSISSMIKLTPAAINVSLFRPYLWEVRNPLMLISALESSALLLITLWVAFKAKGKIFFYMQKPDILFCLIFALVFAFAVGVSTYNFGTLSRYKIPLLPYYTIALGLLIHYWKSDKNESEFDLTE